MNVLKALKTFSTITLLSIASANAAIIDNGLFTSDDISGLDWLDLTETQSLSYNDVSSQFGFGGDFNGWRYATGDEFNTLIYNATGVNVLGNGAVTLHSGPELSTLSSYLGATSPSTLQNSTTYGLLGDLASVDTAWAALISIEQPIDWSRTYNFAFGLNTTASTFGSYLVRTNAVPEPSILFLFGLGLAGLSFTRRKVLK